MLTVVDPGWQATVQDGGRPGYAHLGVPTSGMVDPRLAALVNRLVGNPPAAALIEVRGRLTVRADRPLVVADSVERAPVALAAGTSLRLADDPSRVWHYLAVRGGVDVAPTLGSRSTDTLSGLGPAPLAAGNVLAVGPDPGEPITTDVAPLRHLGDTVRISAGPRADWFAGWHHTLDRAEVTVTDTSRVGARLAGPALRRTVGHELPSEGLVTGAIQVPPSGEFVVMLPDHPTTGGYPVVAVVHPDDVAIVAQSPPGRRLRLVVTHHPAG